MAVMTSPTMTSPSAVRRAPMAPAEPIDAVLDAQGQHDVPAAVVHFSFARPDSYIGVRGADQVGRRVFSFLALPGTGAGVLAAIEAVEVGTDPVLDAFEAAFPEAVARLRRYDAGLAPATSALYWLLGAVGVLLDVAEDVLERAAVDGGEAVALDVALIEDGGQLVLDGRRLLRSVMENRLAGVPQHVLLHSTFAALGGFAAQAVRQLAEQWTIGVVVCAGDLFEHNEMLRRHTLAALRSCGWPVLTS